MLISVVNHTKGKLSDEQVQEGIRAVNRQIAHDFRLDADSRRARQPAVVWINLQQRRSDF